MSTPVVSFVVPCYNLGHYLHECVGSILFQTYTRFEVLIMDDCSPDNTPDVARSFKDPRVHYIRNEHNIGHLRNYNKGISLSRGVYVWLISADDRLTTPYVLHRYVAFMNLHPTVGYVFSRGIEVIDGDEAGVLGGTFNWGAHDALLNGRAFLSKLLSRGGGVLAASCMVRKDCYDLIERFPLDMPHQADLYLWCVWALYYDVGYFSEPMVAYRRHDLAMSTCLARRDPKVILADQINIQWSVKRRAVATGHGRAVRTWRRKVASLYAYGVASRLFNSSPYRLSLDEVRESVLKNAVSSNEVRQVLVRVYASVGDECYRMHFKVHALEFYFMALSETVLVPGVWLKLALLKLGAFGVLLRRLFQIIKLSLAGTSETD